MHGNGVNVLASMYMCFCLEASISILCFLKLVIIEKLYSCSLKLWFFISV